MSLAIHSLFYNKIFKASTHYRLSCLAFVFIFYLFFGSYIHVLLNSHSEFEERIKLTEYLNTFYSQHTCVDKQNAKEFLEFMLHASNVNGIVLGQNGHNTESTEYPPSWKFGGETIFFTFTLISTIGYGYLTPSTDTGKLFCVFYLLIGVPLSFLVFSSIAERIEYAIKYPNSNENVVEVDAADVNEEIVAPDEISSMDPTSQTKRIYLKFMCATFLFVLFIYVIPSIVFSNLMEYPKWSFLDGFYFCYISISTVGFGDFIPGRGLSAIARDNYRLAMTAYLFIGIVLNIVYVNMIINLPAFKTFNEKFIYTQFNNSNYSHLSDDNGNQNDDQDDEDTNSARASSSSHDTTVIRTINQSASSRNKTKIV